MKVLHVKEVFEDLHIGMLISSHILRIGRRHEEIASEHESIALCLKSRL